MDTSREPNLKECAAEFHHKIISNKNITKDVRHALIQTGKATNQALEDLDTVYNRYKKIRNQHLRVLFNYEYGCNASAVKLYGAIERANTKDTRK